MDRQAESRVKCAFQQRMRHGTQFTMDADPISHSFQIPAHSNENVWRTSSVYRERTRDVRRCDSRNHGSAAFVQKNGIASTFDVT